MLTKMFESIVSKLWDTFLSKMAEQIADDAHNNMENIKNFEIIFETQLRNLKSLSAKACDTEKEFENAEISGRKKRKREVEVWLGEVRSIQEQVAELGNQVESEGFIMRLMDGRTIAKLNEQVDRLVEQSQNFGELVIDVSETREVTLLANGMVGKAFGTNMETILKLLETKQVSSIGVYGMGGVGKTTLAKHVHNRLQEQSKGCVFWVTVSQQFTITGLQDKVARFLGVHLLDGEDEDIRAAQIHRALSQRKNLVLILDDVWQNIDMLKVGCIISVEGCRLILTTRSLQVCRQFRCGRVIPVDKLPKNEAWELFNETLQCGIELSPPVEDIAKDVAELCGGLPLGIITVAGSMRGETSIHTWKNAFAELKECVVGQDGMGEVDEVFKILKYSFDGLKKNHHSQSNNEFNTLQLCFLYCSLYPEDQRIGRMHLVDRFISEGLMDQRKNWRAQLEQGQSILDKLVNICLLESDDNDECAIESVKMHDLVRGMALKIVEGRYMTRAGYSLGEIRDEHDWTEGLEKVSFMSSGIKRIADGISPNCPKLKTLILFSNNLEKVIPNSFFARMPSLCTLDLFGTGITILPDSICDMKSLKALLLRTCWKLETVPYLGKLKALRELDLSLTAIKKVPQGVEELCDLRVLSVYAFGLEMFSRGLLLKLGLLQCVTFPFHIQVPIEEIEGLKLLEGFTGTLKNANDFNCFVTTFGNDTFYRIIVQSEDTEYCWRLPHLREDFTNELILSKCNLKDEKVLGQGIVHLEVERCEGMRICFVDLFSPLNHPTSLKRLTISSCGGIECVLRSEEGSSSQISKTLEDISLFQLEDLKELIQEEIGASAAPAQPVFSSLTHIHIGRCNKMRKVGLAVLEAPNLTGINIQDCRKIEEIFDDEGRGCVSLPRLEWLELRGLPRLRKLGLSALSPNLVRMEIGLCKEIEAIFEDEGRSSITLPTLDQLTLFHLPKLKSVCRPTMICNSIRYITMKNCPSLTKKLPVHVDVLPPPTLERIAVDREWWESLEWENPSHPHHINHSVEFDNWDYKGVHFEESNWGYDSEASTSGDDFGASTSS